MTWQWIVTTLLRKIITQGVNYGIQGNWCLFQSKKDRALQEKGQEAFKEACQGNQCQRIKPVLLLQFYK